MLAEGRLYMSELARAFGVTPSTISSIARGNTWSHVKVGAVPTVADEVGNETGVEEESSVNE